MEGGMNRHMGIDIGTRPAGIEDLGWLAGLFTQAMQQAITAARGSWNLAREDAQFRAQLRMADTRVIQLDGADVGFLTMRALDDGLIEVHTLCVSTDRQGMGIGACIMRTVLDAARAAGSAVELSVLKSNPRARHFYARLGFGEIGSAPHHIRMRWPDSGTDRK